jgi:hypothetical protein
VINLWPKVVYIDCLLPTPEYTCTEYQGKEGRINKKGT